MVGIIIFPVLVSLIAANSTELINTCRFAGVPRGDTAPSTEMQSIKRKIGKEESLTYLWKISCRVSRVKALLSWKTLLRACRAQSSLRCFSW